ncbi:hypothetical protein [Stenotrophomonas acidaminiphila]|uniref:hypothetical protein n=1 Tax=Stenotrophomonas acidaminiphila TaxID=128780 RepID=UPI0015FD02D9|nr:hypothetical protein [Stenotrophomonas acidaminiphila]
MEQAGNPLYPVDAVLALHWRIYATLSDDELAVFDYYAQQGRKFGIGCIISDQIGEDRRVAVFPTFEAAPREGMGASSSVQPVTGQDVARSLGKGRRMPLRSMIIYGIPAALFFFCWGRFDFAAASQMDALKVGFFSSLLAGCIGAFLAYILPEPK